MAAKKIIKTKTFLITVNVFDRGEDEVISKNNGLSNYELMAMGKKISEVAEFEINQTIGIQ